MKSTIIKLTEDLVKLKTVSGDLNNQNKGIKFIVDWLAGSKLKHKVFEKNSVLSLLIFGRDLLKFDIVFHGHLDVVPADEELFELKQKRDRLFGRGALDMKGSLAVMLLLARENFAGKPHALLITTDEEIAGQNGSGYVAAKDLIKMNYFLTGEPTNLAPATSEKGVFWVMFKVAGKAAHTAKPWEGKNPLLAAAKLVTEIGRAFPVPIKENWTTTVIPTAISSTNSQNQLAAEMLVKVDCRYVPNDDPQKIIAQLKTLSPGLEVQYCEPALAHLDHFYTRKIKDLSGNDYTKMHYATDARYFGAKNIPCLIFGPSGEGMHSKDEWVSLSSLQAYFAILKKLVS